MAADQNRVLSRVTEILNLCDPGTYSAVLSSRNKTRNATAIQDFTIEAGLDLLRGIGETPNEFRSALVNQVSLTNGAFLPDHVGDPAYIEIQKYNGATWDQGKRRNYQKIESYRKNENHIYDDIDHDEEGSTLSGYYDLWEKRFYFTGFAARAGLVQIARADTATKIPEILEPIWVKLAVGNSAKAGDGTYSASQAGIYGTQGRSDLAEFKTGRRSFPEVSDPEPTSAIHQ